MSDTTERLFTRTEIVEAINAELGIPVALSTIEKAAMNGGGPKPAARYGKAYLYEKASAFEWARTLITPAQQDAA
jgi:hypothetical protein